MQQTNSKSLSYRCSHIPISNEKRAVIDTISKESVYLEKAIRNLEHQFEYMDDLRRNHSNIFNNPFLTMRLETSLLNAYSLRKCYDAELRKLVAKYD